MAVSQPPTANYGEGSNLLVQFLKVHPAVRFIKHFWVSINGLLYCRILTKSRSLAGAANSSPLRVHVSCIGGFAPINSMDATFVSRTGRASIWPDWSSLHVIAPTHGAVHCNVGEDLFIYKQLALPCSFQRCPRTCLERILTQAREHYSLVFLAAFEIEFYIFKKETSFEDASRKNASRISPSRPWSSAACMSGPYAECVEDCMMAIEMAGLIVEQGHSECSPNQFEISIGPLSAVAAVDSLLCAREIIKETANGHGFTATFLPKPFEELQPTGLHLHLSVHHQRPGMDNVEVGQMIQATTRKSHAIAQETADMFLAGILGRLGLLFAICLPSQDSYLRTSPGEALGSYVAWGKENSSVPVSEVSTGYWEIRSLDWTANIYFAVASYLSAGLLGIKNGERLQLQDPGDLTDHLTSEVREEFGIKELLPKSLAEAMEALIREQYGGLQNLMGEEILDLYMVVKGSEYKYSKSLDKEERKFLYMCHI